MGSALFQVVRHIKFNRDSVSETGATAELEKAKLRTGNRESSETAGYPAGFAVVVEKQNVNETEGPDANKI